ncbi:uncharacterized protein CBL_04843 [Carabus blaptoides fortunei]
MNSSSKIEISKSSLLSLKAEILRKQQEVNRAKLQTKLQQSQTPLRQKNKNNSSNEQNESHNKGIEDRQLRDEIEDEGMLQKSRKMLESKARLYNRLVKGPNDLTEDEIEMNKRYLVQFDRKTREEETKESSDDEHFSDEYEPASNPDEEWVEYTDCLGRTRKCLRKDLEYLKEKDFELSKTLDSDGSKIDKEAPTWVIDTQGTKCTEKISENQNEPDVSVTENSELLSSDMRRELMRQEWEKKEQELLNKTDVHYQDVLFNEARTHGVGYYAFSQDEEERAKQQKELRKLREETAQQQKSNAEQKQLREKQLAARLKAARNRKRARMGLSPEEDEPEVPAPVPEVQENKIDKQKAAEKAAEEKVREEKRKRQIRPWDIGKEGVKKHYEYSQEEWVDKKREERPKEFAPPSAFRPEPRQRVSENEDGEEPDRSLFFTTKKSKKHTKSDTSKADFYLDTSVPPPDFKQKTNSSINPYKRDDNETFGPYNVSQPFESVPIVDECIDFDDEQQRQETEESEVDDDVQFENKRKGAEIAPPSTFEYYGPSSSKSKKVDASVSLEESIAAGLKFLRDQVEKKEKSAEKRNLDY